MFSACAVAFILRENVDLIKALIVYIIDTICLNMMAIFLLMLVKILKVFFEAINFNLKATIHNFDEESIENQVCTLKTILNLRNQTAMLIKQFSNAFGLGLLGNFLYTVGVCTVETYYLYFSYSSNGEEDPHRTYFWLNFSWLFSMLTINSLLGFNCVKTKNEADQVCFMLDNNLEHLPQERVKEVLLILL